MTNDVIFIKNLLTESKNFGKNLLLSVQIWPKIRAIGYEWVTFSRKIGKCMSLLSKFQGHVPTQTKSEYPPMQA